MAGEMERRLCSKNLVHAVFVEGCEVNSSTRRSIMLSGNYHAVAPCHRLAVWDPLNDTKCFILPEILVHLSVPVDGYIGRCVTSLRSRAICISIGGLSMHGNARWGQVLNVEPAYRLSSQSFMIALFAGVHSKGSTEGRDGVMLRWGHEQGLFSFLGVWSSHHWHPVQQWYG